jgi:surfeit locus 1 family protein
MKRKSDIVMAFPFRFRLVPFLATVLAVALGLALGQWQTRRANEKEAIEQRLAERGQAPVLALNQDTVPKGTDAEFRRAKVRGTFQPQWVLYLDNRPYQGKAGFVVMMPFQIAGSDRMLLVSRGWIPRDPVERTRIPAIPTPQGEITLDGVLKRHPGHVMELGEAQALRPGSIVQNLDPLQFAQVSGMKTLPVILEQTSDTADKLVRDWPRPSSGVDKHRGYAFQWYALAGTAFLFFIATGFRRGRQSA